MPKDDLSKAFLLNTLRMIQKTMSLNYNLYQQVPMISFSVKRNGKIWSDLCRVVSDTTGIINIDLILARCIEIHKIKYFDCDRYTRGYTFENIADGDVIYNQYPVALSKRMDRYARVTFNRVIITKSGVDSIVQYTDVYHYLSYLKTSIKIIECNRRRDNVTKYDSRIAKVLKIRQQLYDDIVKLCKDQFDISLGTRRVLDGGMIVPNCYEVYQLYQ